MNDISKTFVAEHKNAYFDSVEALRKEFYDWAAKNTNEDIEDTLASLIARAKDIDFNLSFIYMLQDIKDRKTYNLNCQQFLARLKWWDFSATLSKDENEIIKALNLPFVVAQVA